MGERGSAGSGKLRPSIHFTNRKTISIATLERNDVVQPIALEWLQPDAAMAANSAIMPIEKLITRSGRIATVERAAVAGGASGCAIAINALEAMTAMMNEIAATADA